MSFAGKHFLVVGASGVLGNLISQELERHGARVTGTTHKPNPGKFHQLLFDLEVDDQIAGIAGMFESLDGLVVASGLVGFAVAETTSEVDHQKLMSVNFDGPRKLITALLPKLAGGSISVITGVVADRAFPGMASYIASKSALSAWLDALRIDVKSKGIQVLDAKPGHTETGLATRPLFGMAPKFPIGNEPQVVAQQIVQALIDGRSEC